VRRLAGAVLGIGLLAGRAPALGCQDAERIQQLLARLDDDAIDVRASATTELLESGMAVIPELRRAAAHAGIELGKRLTEIIGKIQERQRLSALLPPPSRITLEARDLPLREVLEKISRLTPTPIDASKVPGDLKVTVSLDHVPLWKALDQICRASGQVMFDVESERVVVTPEPHVLLPGKVTDLFCVTLQRIELSTEVAFGQPERFERFNSVFHVSWEKGTRPCRVKAHIEGITDENGTEVITPGEEVAPVVQSEVSGDPISVEFSLESPRGPGPQSTRLSRFQVAVEFEFALKYSEAKLDLSGGKLPVAESPEFSIRLSRFEHQEGTLAAAVTLTRRGAFEAELSAEGIILRDKKGREYHPIVTEGTSTGNDHEISYQLQFPSTPEHAEFTQMTVRIPTELHRERLDLDLKDIHLK
jgi:hypothetical protein